MGNTLAADQVRRMMLTWEAVSALVVLIAAIVAINLFVTRAIVGNIVQKQLAKFREDIRPIGECDLIHKLVNGRLDWIEAVAKREK